MRFYRSVRRIGKVAPGHPTKREHRHCEKKQIEEDETPKICEMSSRGQRKRENNFECPSGQQREWVSEDRSCEEIPDLRALLSSSTETTNGGGGSLTVNLGSTQTFVEDCSVAYVYGRSTLLSMCSPDLATLIW